MPSIDGTQTLKVKSGEATKFTLTGSDPDPGDTVTFYQSDDGQQGVVLNSQTGEVQYAPDLNTPVDLK
jgi:hypothetical protein